MAGARSYAVVHAATTALRFDESGPTVTFQMFVDGDGDGIRTADIAARIDVPVGGASALADLFPGVTIGVAPEVGTDAVRIGTSNLLSFTTLGTATSGSIFLLGTDGTQLAIRILGATGRTRLERYDPSTRQWVAWF